MTFVENCIPWELDVYVQKLNQYTEEKNQAQAQPS
jgi:hypothetical protein